MLDEMYTLKPAIFGTRLTSANLGARAEAEIKTRAAYLAAHPEFLRQLDGLLPHHG